MSRQTTAQSSPHWITIGAVATRWSCSLDYVRREVWGGRLPARKLGRVWRIAVVDVVAYESKLPTVGGSR